MRGRSYIINLLSALTGGIALVGAALPVQAQGPLPDMPTPSGMHLGPVALAPVFRVAEFGYDSNVYNINDEFSPVGDFTFKLSPSIGASLRSSRVRVSGRSQFDIYYFRALSDLNAVDRDHAAQVDLMVNRVTLFLSGRREVASHRRNFEIDAIAKRRTAEVSVGAAVKLSGKTSFDVSVTRADLEYEPNSFYLDTDLARTLNHRSSGESIAIRYAATPLTRFAVQASRTRARFDYVFARNADELLITPSVEFSPFALVSGRASIGFYKRTYAVGVQPASGPSALVDLSYTLLGRTRFTIAANRRLEYSYLVGVRDYVDMGVSVSVTQRLGESWDVMGRLGRGRISYHQASGNVLTALIPPDETVFTPGLDVGYFVRRTRIGVYVMHDRRDTDQPAQFRGYQRLRIGWSATYLF